MKQDIHAQLVQTMRGGYGMVSLWGGGRTEVCTEKWMFGWKDGHTGGRTDRKTDNPTYRDVRTHLKIPNAVHEWGVVIDIVVIDVVIDIVVIDTICSSCWMQPNRDQQPSQIGLEKVLPALPKLMPDTTGVTPAIHRSARGGPKQPTERLTDRPRD